MNDSPLQFSSYLKQVPPEVIFGSFLKQAPTKRKVLSASTVDTVIERASHPDEIADRFEMLSPEAKRLCAFVYLSGRSGLPVADARGRRTELLKSFLVYETRDEAGNRFLLGFDDLAAVLQTSLVPILADALLSKKNPEMVIALEPWYCLNDLVSVISIASEGQLRKTQSGALTKNAATALSKLLHTHSGTDLLEAASPSWLLTEYAIDRGILEFRDGLYRSLTGAIAAWIRMPLAHSRTDFLISSLVRFGGWRWGLVQALITSSENWFSTHGLPSSLHRDGRRVVSVLAYTGQVHAEADGDDFHFRANPHEQEWSTNSVVPPTSIAVLPDFSMVVPQETPPHELYWCTRMARLVSLDKVYRAQIDREVLFNALSQGIASQDLMQALERWHAPTNVLTTVREWIREYFRISMTTETILISSEESVTAQIASYEGLREFLEPVDAHQVFRIRPGQEQKVRALLVSLGFDPRVPEIPSIESLPSRFPELPHRTIIVDFEGEEEVSQSFHHRTGKYSSELKSLDLSDMLHVIDYSVLMGYRLRFTYAGSPLIKRGEYLIRPIAWRKLKEDPTLEGEIVDSGAKKQFIITKIDRIGVEPDEEDD